MYGYESERHHEMSDIYSEWHSRLRMRRPYSTLKMETRLSLLPAANASPCRSKVRAVIVGFPS